MKFKALFLSVLIALIFSSCARKNLPPPPELSIPKLDTEFEKCAATKAGKDYISSVSMTFLKTANLDKCILEGDPTPKPISIYFNVDAVGKISSVIIKPNTLLSVCIAENVNHLALPPPPKNECIIRILLSFEDDEAPASEAK